MRRAKTLFLVENPKKWYCNFPDIYGNTSSELQASSKPEIPVQETSEACIDDEEQD